MAWIPINRERADANRGIEVNPVVPCWQIAWIRALAFRRKEVVAGVTTTCDAVWMITQNAGQDAFQPVRVNDQYRGIAYKDIFVFVIAEFLGHAFRTGRGGTTERGRHGSDGANFDVAIRPSQCE